MLSKFDFFQINHSDGLHWIETVLESPTQLLPMDVYFVLSYRLRLTVKPNSTLNFTPRVWKVSKAPNNNNSLLSLLIQLVLTLFWKMVSYDNILEYQPIKGHKQWLCLPHNFVVTRVVSIGCQFTIWLGIAISNTCDFWFLFLCLFVCAFFKTWWRQKRTALLNLVKSTSLTTSQVETIHILSGVRQLFLQ